MSRQSYVSRRRLLGVATALGAGGLLCTHTPVAWGRPGSGPAAQGPRAAHARVGEIQE